MGVPEFRIIFKTRDNNLLVDRKRNSDYYFNLNGTPDKVFIKAVIYKLAKEKGVRILSYEITKKNLTALVEWL